MRALIVWLLALMIIFSASAAQAAGVKSISGYANYNLGMSTSDISDFSTFQGPTPDTSFGDNWLQGATGNYGKGVSMPIPLTADLIQAGLTLTTVNNRIEGIILNFAPCDKDFDNDTNLLVGFVKSLRTGLLAKYDKSLVIADQFDYNKFTGALGLADSNGYRIVMVWTGFETLSVNYYTPGFWKIINDELAKQARGEVKSVGDL